MKKIVQLLIFSVCILTFASCNKIIDKAKEKTGEILTEQIEKAKIEAEVAAAEATEKASAAELVIANEEETLRKEPEKTKEWWHDDFRIVYTQNPAGIGGATSNIKYDVVMQRRGDAFRLITELGGQKVDYIYKKEDDVVARYLFNPENKKANRQEDAKRTIEDYVKEKLSEHGVLQKKDPTKGKDVRKDGTETISGRKCGKWVAEKNIMGNITRASYWVDEEHGFVLKLDSYIKLGNKETSGNVLTVSEFTFNPDPKEVILDFSDYELIN